MRSGGKINESMGPRFRGGDGTGTRCVHPIALARLAGGGNRRQGRYWCVSNFIVSAPETGRPLSSDILVIIRAGLPPARAARPPVTGSRLAACRPRLSRSRRGRRGLAFSRPRTAQGWLGSVNPFLPMAVVQLPLMSSAIPANHMVGDGWDPPIPAAATAV